MHVATSTTEPVVEQEDVRGEATFEEIEARAYEIHLSGAGGDDVENWLRAEQELNAALRAE